MNRPLPDLSGQNPLPVIATYLGALMEEAESNRELLREIRTQHDSRITACEKAIAEPDPKKHLDDGEIIFVRVFRRAFVACGALGTIAGGSYGGWILTHH
jgi:hypothetical protein